MKNKKKRPNKFRIRLFIIFWIALVIPCMLISYILYQNSQEKSKQSMAEDIQHTLTENMASVEGKLDAVSDAGVSLKFAMEQTNVVMIPDLKCRDIDIDRTSCDTSCILTVQTSGSFFHCLFLVVAKTYFFKILRTYFRCLLTYRYSVLLICHYLSPPQLPHPPWCVLPSCSFSIALPSWVL